MTTRERRALTRCRICFCCRQPVPPGAGLFDAWLDILTHQGFCAARVRHVQRDYSRSPRGRRLPAAQVLRALERGQSERPTGSDDVEAPYGSHGSRTNLFTRARTGKF